ncbi:MAG: hypothetical protein J1E37_00150 [Prevotella sp.]|nr:hypothetical protein [Prevotella sp.]
MMKTKLLGMIAAAGMLLATSCSQEQTETYLSQNDLVDFSISVGVEGGVSSRTSARRADGEGTTFSDGTRATELYFAIYDSNNKLYKATFTFDNGITAESVSSSATDDPLYYKASVTFPFTFSCQLVKGMDYKIVFWAQSKDAEKYYDLSAFPVVEVKYKDESGNFHANNDEMRDAFCVSYPIKASSVGNAHTIVLTRPLSQINVGVTDKAWDILLTTGTGDPIDKETQVEKLVSSMIIENAATKFDVRANDIVKNNVTKVEYQPAKIPSLIEELDEKTVTDNYLNVNLNLANGPEKKKFYWVSMCYILANDETKTEDGTTYGTVIDELNINICDKFKHDLQNVPVRRNYRTNILFDEDWWVTQQYEINLDRAYDDDYNGTEGNDGEYNGINN